MRTVLALGSIPVGIVAAHEYAREIEPRWNEVTHHDVVLPRLSSAFDNFKIVHLSDIHIDAWMTQERLAAIVAQANSLNPDLIVITGDFVTESGRQRPIIDAMHALASLRAPAGVLGILGNHDYWHNPFQIRQLMAENNVRDIANDVVSINRAGAALHLVGLDDLFQNPHFVLPLEQAQPAIAALAAKVPGADAVVMLAHEPDVADLVAQNGRFDLQLSGHSHGGQVTIPIYGPPLLPPLCRKYVRGWYQIEAMKLYTHRGLGVVGPRLRFGNRPEIAAFVLHAAAQ